MRRILIDKARRKSRAQAGGGHSRLDIADLELAETTPDDNLLLIDEALKNLAQEDPEQARIVVLKFFGGLTNEEVAENCVGKVKIKQAESFINSVRFGGNPTIKYVAPSK
jgi:DNA-directed RNA polymerase specialized sigma24 family protein